MTTQNANQSAVKASTFLERMTDGVLFSKAMYFGAKALHFRQKFIGLLPEVNRRKLYQRRGFGSIFEFAFKLAGLSEQQVRTALNLERRFEDLPVLKGFLEKGEISINKLVRIQSIATKENEEELATALKVLSKGALETLIRDEKSLDENGLGKPQNEGKSVHGQSLGLSEEVTKKLTELHDKGVNINEELMAFLQQREQEIVEEKEEIVKSLQETDSRYVQVRTKKVLAKEHGGKCSIPHCKKPAEELHHTQTFILSHRHDPHFLAPLCREHHQIAHTINLNFYAKRRRAVL